MKATTACISFLLASGLFLGTGLLVSGRTGGGLAAAEEADDKVLQTEVNTLEELRNTPAEQIAAWDKYDSRAFHIVTKVTDQRPYDLCWAFSTAAAAEVSILREGCDPSVTEETLDLDEIELAKTVRGKFLDPFGVANGENLSPTQEVWNQPGTIDFVSRSASHWQGFYQTGNAPQEADADYCEYVLDGFEMCNNDVGEIKSLVARYGAAAFEYNAMFGDVEYYLAQGQQTHASAIVGWDDSVPKNSFHNASGQSVSAQRDGAWIVKNSWGENMHENDGYFYLSYDSQLINIIAFDLSPHKEGTYLYNYSGNNTCKYYWTAPYAAQSSSRFAYIFTPQLAPKAEEQIDSVCVGVSGKATVEVKIYTDLAQTASGKYQGTGVLAATAKLRADCSGKGFYTIPLEHPVVLDEKPFCVMASASGGTILFDHNGNTGNTVCYTTNGLAWNKLRIGDGQLPAIHPVSSVDLGKRSEQYGNELFTKVHSFEEAANSLSEKGFCAENYEAFTAMQKTVSSFTDEEREKLWLPDITKLNKYERLVQRWETLVKGAQTPIDLSKKLL